MEEKKLNLTIKVLRDELESIGSHGDITIPHLHLKAYMRKNKRWYRPEKKFFFTIEIGSIDVEKEFRGKGNAKYFLKAVEYIAQINDFAVYIEGVHNKDVVNYFETTRSWDYIEESIGGIPNYWLFIKNE
jgi:hypothetical protein